MPLLRLPGGTLASPPSTSGRLDSGPACQMAVLLGPRFTPLRGRQIAREAARRLCQPAGGRRGLWTPMCVAGSSSSRANRQRSFHPAQVQVRDAVTEKLPAVTSEEFGSMVGIQLVPASAPDELRIAVGSTMREQGLDEASGCSDDETMIAIANDLDRTMDMAMGKMDLTRETGVAYKNVGTEGERISVTEINEAVGEDVGEGRTVHHGVEGEDTVHHVRLGLETWDVAPKDVSVVDGAGGIGVVTGSVQGMILLNIGAALFGSNQVAIKATEEFVSPNALSLSRFAIAALCFSPSIVKGLRDPQLRVAAVELGLWLFGGYTAQAIGLQYTTAGRGAFTGTFTVLAVPLLVGFSGRTVSPQTWVGAAVALIGVGLLTTDGANPNLGDALCILSAIFFGVHKWRTESITTTFNKDTTELISIQLAVLAVAAGLITMPEVVMALREHTPGELVSRFLELPWPSLVYMGIATTAFTLWIEMHALKEVSAPLAALIYTAEPLWGALFACTFLKERWGPTGWLGAALIMAASLGSQLLGNGVVEEKRRTKKAD